ncbi:MAG: hypothetical protein VB144_02830 [Clostridia bacterium]|nr:hypothetical protein [Clostridia bacterium]
MPTRFRLDTDQRGSVLVISLVALAILGTISAGLIMAASSTYQIQMNNRNKVQALLAAEGGAEKAYNLIKTDSSYRTTRDFSAQIGTVSASGFISRDGGSYSITSTATVNRVSQTVQLAVYTGVYSYGLYAGQFIQGEQNNYVHGADVVAGGTITGIAVDPGYGLYPRSPQVFPVFAENEYSKYPSPQVVGDTITVTGANYLSNGIAGKNDVNIICPSGNGILYISGDLVANNNLIFSGDLVVIVDGHMEAKNNAATSWGMTHLIVKKNVHVMNNMTLTGSVLAEGSFQCKNNLAIDYQPGAPAPTGSGIGGWAVSWRR